MCCTLEPGVAPTNEASRGAIDVPPCPPSPADLHKHTPAADHLGTRSHMDKQQEYKFHSHFGLQLSGRLFFRFLEHFMLWRVQPREAAATLSFEPFDWISHLQPRSMTGKMLTLMKWTCKCYCNDIESSRFQRICRLVITFQNRCQTPDSFQSLRSTAGVACTLDSLSACRTGGTFYEAPS